MTQDRAGDCPPARSKAARKGARTRRSLKRGDLEDIGLKVVSVDADPKLAEVVYRIQTVCRFLFETTSVFKIFATADAKLFRTAAPTIAPQSTPQAAVPDAVQIDVKCPSCGTLHRLYAKLMPNPKIDAELKAKGLVPFPADSNLKCSCGHELDLSGIRNDLELKTGKRIIGV